MPRSGQGLGQRPYECVKRAWHSDLHKPIRGLIIQRILRIATEVHSPETRKNKEWQTKFPSVVMKAEQILYSKANSEAEYVDPATLWERLNDAIDIIIRRDEATETGNPIHPCIEAALVLGCVPVRESRSQQLKNPRKYLHLKEVEDTAQTTKPIDYITNNSSNSPPMANQPISSPLNTQITPKITHIAVDSNTLTFGSVYPMHYINHSPQNLKPENILLGRPVCWPIQQTGYVPSTMNLLPYGSEENDLSHVKPGDGHESTDEKDCDLSLRLGLSDQMQSSKYILQRVEFSFFPRDSPCDTSQTSSNKRVKEESGVGQFGQSETSRKRSNGSIHWLRDHQPGQFDVNS